MNTRVDTGDLAVGHRRHLAETLVALGLLGDSRWRSAWEAVPRHLFVPRFAIGTPGRPGAAGAVWHDAADLEHHSEWLAAAYRNVPLITGYAPNGTATSSSTEPSLMAQMLELLDVDDGHRVLEIGTGTGYNAALLAHRLGARNVTTIDIDPDLAHGARRALDTAGHPVTVLIGDGADGAPRNAPFDRIIATCGVDRIPGAWIEQLAPGGAILANVSRGLILLRNIGQGAVCGQFGDQAGFMAMHAAAEPPTPTGSDIFTVTSASAERQHAVRAPADLDFTVASFLASLVADRSQLMSLNREDGTLVGYRWWHPPSGSWVRVELRSPSDAQAHATGPRDLWTELAPILAAWELANRPDLNHYGLTITPERHLLWLGTPHGPRRWRLRA